MDIFEKKHWLIETDTNTDTQKKADTGRYRYWYFGTSLGVSIKWVAIMKSDNHKQS